MERRRPHIVLCAALGRGHTTPMVCLARALAITGQVSVTVLFENRTALSSVHPGFMAGDVQFVPIRDAVGEEDPSWMVRKPNKVRAGRESTGAQIPFHFPSKEADFERILVGMLASRSPPKCVVNDFTISWAALPCSKLHVPRYVLYTDPASFMALALHSPVLVENGVFPVHSSTSSISVPGLPPLLPKDVTRFMWDQCHPAYPIQEFWHQQILESSAGILFNTFYELESSAIDALRTQIVQHDALASSLFPVGPLLFPEDDTSVFASFLGQSCFDWLDTKNAGSVLFISFGSYAFVPNEQLMELALGLEASGCQFLWVITLAPGREESELESILPQGFIQRLSQGGSGLVVQGWVPQHRILKHPAVGGFLTHCGWNSVLECISLAGVPMICWPFSADQPTTCRVIVDGLGIGVEVVEDESGMVSRSEVERLARLVMSEVSDEMRKRASRLKDLAGKAVADKHGSSNIALRIFIDQALLL